MRNPVHIAAVAATILCLPLTIPAQQLVRDIAQTGGPASSHPRDFVVAPGFVCFLAKTGDSGTEAWTTDGTAAGTFRLREVTPGLEQIPTVDLICEYQGKVLYAGGPYAVPSRLFLTDGTIAGTVEVPNLGIVPESIVRLPTGQLLANTASQTYVTDLTAAGTVSLPGMRRFQVGIEIGGVTYGSCERGNGIYELWATDGTPAGTRLIAALQGQRPYAYTEWNGRIYFIEGASFFSLWLSSTDGTAGVTRHLQLFVAAGPPTDRMFVRGNELFFSYGGAIVTTDLTTVQTLQVPCTNVGLFHEHAGALYFYAATVASGFELWTTDGTVAGTTQVAELMPGSAGSHPEHMLSQPGGMIFRALTPQGRRLMRLFSPTSIVDLGPIPDDAPSDVPVTGAVSGFVPFQGSLLFGGTDASGTELWHYDGVQPPARLLDLDANGPGLLHPGAAVHAAVADRLYFTAYDDVANGIELWSTDGTAAGTRILDLTPGPTSEFQVLTNAPATGDGMRYGDRLAFASRNRVALTDGTLAGTTNLVGPQTANYGSLQVRGDELWFRNSFGIVHSDGTPAGTAPFTPQVPGSLYDFLVLPDRIVWQSAGGLYGIDSGGAVRFLIDIGSPATILRFGDDLVLGAGVDGLYVSDGTPAGTAKVATYTAWPARLAMRGGFAYSLAGPDLWRTDGTVAGTAVVATLPATMTVDSICATASAVFVVASTPATGRELWRIDESTGQAVLVVDLAPGTWSGVLSAAPLGAGDLLFLAAGDDATGVEPYVSDGTAAGTMLLADVNPGRGNSNPKLIGIADDAVYLAADDGVHGVELWQLPIALAAAASVQTFGVDCPGSTGALRFATNAVPRPGTTTFGFGLANARPLALCAFGIATDLGAVRVNGCDVLLGGSISSRLAIAGLGGDAAFPLQLPANPALLGVRFVTQAFALDAAVPSGFASSEGLIFVIGR